MKIIDLLNKIAKGKIQEVKYIKYKNHKYEYFNGDYKEEAGAYDSNWLFANEIIDLSNLNDEIEILDNLEEEKKIPEKISTFEELTKITENFNFNDILLADKINEIIDYLKSKGE